MHLLPHLSTNSGKISIWGCFRLLVIEDTSSSSTVQICNNTRDNQDEKLRGLLSQIYMVTDNEYLRSLTCGSGSLKDAHAAKCHNITQLIKTNLPQHPHRNLWQLPLAHNFTDVVFVKYDWMLKSKSLNYFLSKLLDTSYLSTSSPQVLKVFFAVNRENILSSPEVRGSLPFQRNWSCCCAQLFAFALFKMVVESAFCPVLSFSKIVFLSIGEILPWCYR